MATSSLSPTANLSPAVSAAQRYAATRARRVLPSMKCPLTKELFKDPVIASDGYTYEREAILDHIKHKKTSPKDPHHQLDDHVRPHHTIKALVESFLDAMLRPLDPKKLLHVGEKIGRGTSNRVYRGEYDGKGTVALSESSQARALALVTASFEARTLARLMEHDHVTLYLGLCEYNDHKDPLPRVFLVTEYAPFGSLQDVLFGRLENQQHWVNQLSLAHNVTFMVQICAGMTHLARHGEVHRDLAARNVLVFEFDENDPRKTVVKLADFGLAVNTYGRSYVYISPSGPVPQRGVDQHSSPSGVVNTDMATSADDVWAFGVTCIEIMTIRRLAANATEADVITYMEEEYLTGVTAGRPPSRPNECPERLWDILKTCFKTERINRATFNALEPLLTQYLSSLPAV